jgi:hypothetical protein
MTVAILIFFFDSSCDNFIFFGTKYSDNLLILLKEDTS